jgi:hypothetical protein
MLCIQNCLPDYNGSNRTVKLRIFQPEIHMQNHASQAPERNVIGGAIILPVDKNRIHPGTASTYMHPGQEHNPTALRVLSLLKGSGERIYPHGSL